MTAVDQGAAPTAGALIEQVGCRNRLVRWEVWDEDLADGIWTDLGPCGGSPVVADVTVRCTVCGDAGRQDGPRCEPCLDAVLAEYTNPDAGDLWCPACHEFAARLTVNGKDPRP